MRAAWWRLLFASALAVVALTAYFDRTRNLNAIRDNNIAACERGNTTRANQRVIVNVLLPTAKRFARTDPRPDVRAYLRMQIPLLELARQGTRQVDCERVND